jgi:hypothetical protein
LDNLLILLAMMLVLVAVITAAYAWEKRLVWPYVPAQEAHQGALPTTTLYMSRANEAAASAGFALLGTFADGKSNLYRVRYNFRRSSSGDVLALIGCGTIASMPVQTIWLYSVLGDGHCLVTFNAQSGGELDLAGMTHEALVCNAAFDELLRHHRVRIETTSATIIAFSQEDALGDFRRFRERRTERLVELGYVSYLDAARTVWRYTLRGAVTLAFRQYSTGIRRVLLPDTLLQKRPVDSHNR